MKKFIVCMISACVAFSPVMAATFAKEEETMLISSKEEISEAEQLKKVLLNVKEKISIPEELTEFSYTFNYSNNKYSQGQHWNLVWRSKENSNRLTVKATNDGHILSYTIRDYGTDNIKPVYLKEELVGNATDFIKQVTPEVFENIKLKSIEFSGVYLGTYLYTFERIENGIRMPDDTVTVAVNYETGEVKDFSLEWNFDIEIPSAEVNLSFDEAREKIGANVNMELKYMRKTEEIDGEEIVKAYLVYVPDKDYIAIDAKSGEIYESHDEFFNVNSSTMDYAGSASSAEGAMDEELTEQELAKILEMKELISKENAIDIVASQKNILLLDDNAKAVNANLTQSYSGGENSYIWSISFNDPRDVEYNSKDTYRAYARATVDAKTGKLLSFNSSVRSYYNEETKEWEEVNIKYTEDNCKNIFEEFVKKLELQKFSNTKLTETNDNTYVLKYVNDVPVYGGYSYKYSRFNEGIEYSYDRIYGKVDGVTGKIYSYNVVWTDNIEFESPENSISEREAYDFYSNLDGFELVYEINNKHYIENNLSYEEYYDYSELYSLEKEVRLVYRTNIYPSRISPFTGEQLDYSGNVYENKTEKEYTDISGFWGERSINLITDMGYTFDESEFMPNKIITKEELLTLFNLVGAYVDESKYEAESSVTKLMAVKMLIDELGLEKVANLSGIYNVTFNDIELVNESDIGYLALAKALGIISGDDNNNCNVLKDLTRIEAVCMALKFVSVK